MNVTPPTRTLPARPVALLRPGHRALEIDTVDGTMHAHGPKRCYELLERLEGHACYTGASVTELRHTTGARHWEAQSWRGRVTRMALDGTMTSVVSLRGTLEDSTDPWGDLSLALGWLGEHGVRAASVSQMGWNLWRNTLSDEVRLGVSPRIGRAALYGGRQEIREARTYSHMVAADIAAAYPHSMAARPYALGLRRVANTTTLDPTVPGIVHALIDVDGDMDYAPVPVRLATDVICFERGRPEGFWPWCEVAAAAELGCQVTVKECWAPSAVADLFGRWWELVALGRQLSGAAGRIIKAIANSLWGLFGMKGDNRATIRWADEAGLRPLSVPKGETQLPHDQTAHIAAETSGRVRTRLLREGLYGEFPAPVHVDTDGVIVRRRAVDVGDHNVVPGAWRPKNSMRRVEIRAPQVYRYQCGKGCGVTHPPWHYVTAGVPAAAARSVFEKVGRGGSVAGLCGIDLVLPSRNTIDPGTREAVRSLRLAAGGVWA